MIRWYRNFFKVEETIPDMAIVYRMVFGFLLLSAIANASYIRIPELIYLFMNDEKESVRNKVLIKIATFDNRALPGDEFRGGN